MSRFAFSLSLTGAFLGFIAVVAQAQTATAGGASGVLAGHRAVYDLTLVEANPLSGINDIRGRMVSEFNGAACVGYTLTTRLVTQIDDRDGQTILVDSRTSWWEKGNGRRFRFNSSEYLNEKVSDVTQGQAKRGRKNRPVVVRLEKPEKQKLHIPSDVMFPTQHSRRILKTALSGKKLLQAYVYDGSEKGHKVFQTTTFIGKLIPPGEKLLGGDIANTAVLKTLKSWPVTISYFEGKPTGEQTPVYELAFRLYANGISRGLKINYGDFVIKGDLHSIEFIDTPKCKVKRVKRKRRKVRRRR